MNHNEAVAFFGGRRKIAKLLGVTYGAVQWWKDHGIPLPRQYQLHVLSNGKLPVDQPKQETVE